MKGKKHQKAKQEQKKTQSEHKKFKKLMDMVDKHLIEVSHLQHKVFKLLLKLSRNIRTDEEYNAVKNLVEMYRKNEQDLGKIVKLYETHLEDYEEEQKFKK